MALSDSARDFWDRISPRERKLVVFLVIAIPLGAALWLGLSIRDGLVSMEKRNEQTRDALDVVARIRAAGGPQVEDPSSKLPTTPIALTTYVVKALDKTGLKSKGPIDERPSVTKNGVVTTTASCAVEDISTEQLKAFLQEIEGAQKAVAVTHLVVRRDRRDTKKLDASFDISTYSMADSGKSGDKDDKDKDAEKKEGG